MVDYRIVRTLLSFTAVVLVLFFVRTTLVSDSTNTDSIVPIAGISLLREGRRIQPPSTQYLGESADVVQDVIPAATEDIEQHEYEEPDESEEFLEFEKEEEDEEGVVNSQDSTLTAAPVDDGVDGIDESDTAAAEVEAEADEDAREDAEELAEAARESLEDLDEDEQDEDEEIEVERVEEEAAQEEAEQDEAEQVDEVDHEGDSAEEVDSEQQQETEALLQEADSQQQEIHVDISDLDEEAEVETLVEEAEWVANQSMQEFLPVRELLMADAQELLFAIKVFTCNRNESLHRLLTSLQGADYMGHRVDLEIIIDHCETREERLQCQALATAFEWEHGHKAIRVRAKQAGLRIMWFEAWYPVDEQNIGVVLEDDMELSKFWYRFAYRVISSYYLKERDDNMIGLCLHPFGLPNLREPFYKSRSICSWGAVLLPRTWRNFLTWVDEHIDNSTYRPYLPPGTQLSFHRWGKVNYWMRANKDVWTSWFYRFIYESGNLFTISYCLDDCSVGAAINHQEAGTNYPTTMETKWQLIDKDLTEYVPALPALNQMDLRLDGLLTVGPCRASSCPILAQLDGDPREDNLPEAIAMKKRAEEQQRQRKGRGQ
eukprot:jgi/Chlat1/7542/Chrsp62S07033